MEKSANKQSISVEMHHRCRPFCPCCGGGDIRKGYTLTKYKSRLKSKKARKPRYKDHR